MAKNRKTKANGSAQEAEATRQPKSLEIASRGIKTGHDFANLMSALMSDIISGRVTPNVGNATCNAGGKLLKVVEMQFKYGVDGPGQRKVLTLAMDTPLAPVGQITSEA